MDLNEWISEICNDNWHCIVKRLSANDTLANRSHQAGPYLPRTTILELVPSLNVSRKNPDKKDFPAFIDSHEETKAVRLIWYNGKIVGDGTRNETRLTGWGGANSPILDPDSTGAVCIFAFPRKEGSDSDCVRIWLASSLEEEEIIEGVVGEIEPGRYFELIDGQLLDKTLRATTCFLQRSQIPAVWLTEFPSGFEIVNFVINRLGKSGGNADELLMKRRDCEFEVFQSVEREFVIPRIAGGFKSVESFLEVAGSVMNRRKSRTGRSLELHLKAIFDDAGLQYSHGQKSEGNKKPDFIFPGTEKYRDKNATQADLRMLGVKTTLKDRWRQILNEADRIPRKHLFTLQQGVSLNQFEEMKKEGITLVVPAAIRKSYEKSIRPELMTLTQFMDEVKLL